MQYDYLSRMKVASYYDLTDAGAASSDQKFREEVTYADLRGNIKTLQRNGLYADGAAWKVGQIDKLTYTTTSGTNKLASVSDSEVVRPRSKTCTISSKFLVAPSP